MKLTVIYLVVIISVICVHVKSTLGLNRNIYDSIDIDEVLSNDRLLKRYTDCVLDKVTVRCPKESREMKKDITITLESKCGDCTDGDKKKLKKVIEFLIKNKKETWDELKAKFDPNDKYMKQYEDMVKEGGVTF
ncbi:ejaculatory bulb-specific protein 3-like [Cardiocondyla obscurior]|uniref:ejaculatory bulb-specific protein 3-like n=1 Tax=Cardiocondyla obscurior TaxID=286306 RepID=UPI0039655C10